LKNTGQIHSKILHESNMFVNYRSILLVIKK